MSTMLRPDIMQRGWGETSTEEPSRSLLGVAFPTRKPAHNECGPSPLQPVMSLLLLKVALGSLRRGRCGLDAKETAYSGPCVDKNASLYTIEGELGRFYNQDHVAVPFT